MRDRVVFVLAGFGVLAAVVSAYLAARPAPRVPPAFDPAANPYDEGIYANGIIESYQAHGANINIYPEVSGQVVEVLVTEGQEVTAGTPLLRIDDTAQRSVVAQQAAQAAAARAALEALEAQPRKEALAVAEAEVAAARAELGTARDQLARQTQASELDPRAVSKLSIDNARNAVKAADARVEVAERQLELTRAGAWEYDVANQRRQVEAAAAGEAAAKAELDEFTLVAPADGVVLSVAAARGSYVSPQGAYDTYTERLGPVIVMGHEEEYLAVRVYIDEILIPRLPPPERMEATMFVRGSDQQVPLEFERVQPYVSPKIQLSNARTERVDVRVLPVIFRFRPPPEGGLYPGQLVDVYVATR